MGYDKVMYGKKLKGVIRSTVVTADAAGKVAHHWPKVSVKGHVDQVVEAVKALEEASESGREPKPDAAHRLDRIGARQLAA